MALLDKVKQSCQFAIDEMESKDKVVYQETKSFYKAVLSAFKEIEENCSKCAKATNEATLHMQDEMAKLKGSRKFIAYTDGTIIPLDRVPVKPSFDLLGGEPYRMYCGSCKRMITEFSKDTKPTDMKHYFVFCPICGQPIDWNGGEQD